MKLITIPKKYIASFLALVMVFGVFVFVAPVEAQAVEINANATGFGGGLYYSDESGVTSFANGAAIKVVNLMRTSKNEATYTTTDGTNWTTTDAMVWNSSSKNTFQAWYPVAEYSSYDTFTIPTDQGDATKLASADWMTASTGEIDKPGNGVLDLSFQHRLAKVTVTVSEFASQYAEGATLSGATIYSLTADNVSVENANNGVTPYQEGNSVTAIVCPGKYNADATLMEINVKDENGDYTLAVPVNDYLVDNGLAAGSHYTFSLKVGKDVVAISSVTVEGWVEMEIDGGVAEEEVLPASTEAELVAALEKGGNIMLTGDITVSDEYPFGYDITKNTAINLNGHTITGEDVFCLSGYEENIVLTISGNGTVKNTNPNFTSAISGFGTLNLLGGTIEGGTNTFGTTIMSDGWVDDMNTDKHNSDEDTSSITGGYVRHLNCWGGILTISGGHVETLGIKYGTIIISGGTFGFDPTAYLAEGYTATEADGKWTVTPENN